jgi:branched-chain amino acid transport system ATP-binding protein
LAFLEISNLDKHFGGLAAVSEFSLEINEGEICGLIGPNGAGKSTVLNMIGGTFFPDRGKIIFRGEDITNMPAYRRASRGIARVFQRNTLFKSMTVVENVLAASYLHSNKRFTEVFFKSVSDLKREEALYDRAMELLEFVGLQKQSNEMATSLPHGNQRGLCVAVALASNPKLLLLDEPLTGMNAEEITTMSAIVKGLRDTKGITSIVVEHNIRAILGLCGQTVVLNYGKKMMEGTASECVDDPAVIEAYLGAEIDAI